MARLYISQKRIDAWSEENKIRITGDTMTLVELGRSFIIQPGVRFLKVVGDDDPHDLVGLVKEEGELAAMGADHMANSVIYVDTAYEVENGFIGTVLTKGRTTTSKGKSTGPFRR